MSLHSLCFPRACAALAVVALCACQADPVRAPSNNDLTVGGEVYRILCKRVASSTHPEDLTGTQFNDRCDGKAAPEDSDPKLQAMLEMREPMLKALDLTLGELPAEQLAAAFVEDELEDLLLRMVPFYAKPDEVLPNATRSLAAVIRDWLRADSPEGQAAVAALSHLSGREGYRPLARAIGPVRALLGYERLDDVTLAGLRKLNEGGVAHESFVKEMSALGLELASWALEQDEPDDGDKSELTLALELLTATHPNLAEGTPIQVLQRDVRGLPVPNQPAGVMPMPFMDADTDGLADVDEQGRFINGMEPGRDLPLPFATRLIDDAAPRDEHGRALNPYATEPQALYAHWDLDQSVIAALLRDTGKLVTRPEPGVRSPAENLIRGLRGVLGPSASRQEAIGPRTLNFEGPDTAQAPVLDLMHAVGQLLTLDETAPILELLKILVTEHEDVAAEILYTGLRIDEISDEAEYDSAQLVGPGGPGTPHDFWDDLLAIAQRMTRRTGEGTEEGNGLVEDLIRMFADPIAPANVTVFANWMRYTNLATYPNAPSELPDDINGDVTVLANDVVDNTNNVVVPYFDRLPDRTMPDVGTNRSVWSRTLSMIHGLNGVEVCNKQGAVLHVPILEGTGLGNPAGAGPYDECDLFYQEDALQMHSQSVISRAQIALGEAASDVTSISGLACPFGIGCVGDIQEEESHIEGFTDQPTAKSLARFIFAPRNEFLTELFEPLQTIHGVSINEHEPWGLFALEVVDPMANPIGEPTGPGMSYLESAAPLMLAFDNNELHDADGKLVDGYMFGELLSTLHLHWNAPSDVPCMGPPQPTCTQRLDPAAPFFSNQTNVQSYEPLIARALIDEGLIGALHRNAVALTQISIDGKDGITILADFVTRLLTPREGMKYRNGQELAFTNTGKEVGPVTPLYLILDALKGIDKSFETPEYEARHEAWLAARSVLVDIFLGASKDATDPENPVYSMTNRRIPPLLGILVDWLVERIETHATMGDLDTWGPELAKDVEDIASHPIAAHGLDVLDHFWDDEEASRELAGLLAHLFADPDDVTFASMVETTVHAVQFLRDEERSEALARALSILLEPTAHSQDSAAQSQAADSATMKGINVVVRLAESDTQRPTTLNKVLRNLVEPLPEEGRSPLEVYYDAIMRLHRADPALGNLGWFSEDDVRSVANEAATFLDDKEHGLERLTLVIQGRELSTANEGGSATQ